MSSILRNWLLSFLSDRAQFVEVGDCVSDCLEVHAGVPNCFKLLIRDLCFKLPFIKYVDDVSVASVSHNLHNDSPQQALCELLQWCTTNGMHLNTGKTKEMTFAFGRLVNVDDCLPLLAESSVIERVDEFKILGVIFFI